MNSSRMLGDCPMFGKKKKKAAAKKQATSARSAGTKTAAKTRAKAQSTASVKKGTGGKKSSLKATVSKPKTAARKSPTSKTKTAAPKKTTAKTAAKKPAASKPKTAVKKTAASRKSPTSVKSTASKTKIAAPKAAVKKTSATVARRKTAKSPTAAKTGKVKTSPAKKAAAPKSAVRHAVRKVVKKSSHRPTIKPPFEAYKGIRPYMFSSYAHKDMEIVFKVLKKLSKDRYRMWYDEGIEPGYEWPEVVGNSVINCSQFIVFMSPAAADSRNVRNEVNLAFNDNKEIIVVYLKKTNLSSGMRLQIGTVQFINYYELTERKFYDKLTKVLSSSLRN